MKTFWKRARELKFIITRVKSTFFLEKKSRNAWSHYLRANGIKTIIINYTGKKTESWNGYLFPAEFVRKSENIFFCWIPAWIGTDHFLCYFFGPLIKIIKTIIKNENDIRVSCYNLMRLIYNIIPFFFFLILNEFDILFGVHRNF